MIKKESSSLYRNITPDAPLISIILVCLNAEKTIELTLQSIATLDYPNIELIVVDGESSDKTSDILKRYSPIINKITAEKDNGIYDAMNKGLKLATGDYLYFVGADDIIINSWQNLIGKLKSGNTVYYGNAYFPVKNKIYNGKTGFIRLLTKNICHQAIFYPRAVFEKYRYSCEYKLSGDFHLNLLINSDPDFKFKYIDILIAVYSEKGISTNRSDAKFLQDHKKIIRENYSTPVYLYIYSRKILAKWLGRS
jgi:glycosyltransferase involved in cell wall biosynthesis